MTKHELNAKYGMEGGGTRCRVLPRFLTLPPGGKPRAIDDGKASRTNEATHTVETVSLPTCEFVARCAGEFQRLAEEVGGSMDPMLFGTDDESAAYRRVPTSEPESTVISFYSPTKGCVVYQQVFGHPFGLVSAVLNFNRVPELICWVMNVFMAAPTDHYFDDFLVCDTASGQGSAQEVLARIHSCLNLLELEPEKHAQAAERNKALGVWCDVSLAHTEGIVRLEPDQGRIDAVLEALQQCKAAGEIGPDGVPRSELHPALASSILGKLGFLLTSAYGAVGRGAMLPLVHRGNGWDEVPDPDEPGREPVGAEWTPGLEAMLSFLIVLFASRSIMARVLRVRGNGQHEKSPSSSTRMRPTRST